MPDIRRINVVLSGVYGYVIGKSEVYAFTPAQDMHIYKVGWKTGVCKDIRRGDYVLTGVKGESDLPELDITRVPIIDASKVPVGKCDPFSKRYMRLHLPFPEAVYDLEPYEVGEIFAGTAGASLNQLKQFPSLYAFQYDRDPSAGLGLIPKGITGEPIWMSDVPPNDPPASHTANIFILATMRTGMEGADGKMHLFDEKERDAHTRRALASMVDLFCELDLRIEIPDRFSPTKITGYACPEGLTPEQVEDPNLCLGVRWGKVNCHYSNIMIINHSV